MPLEHFVCSKGEPGHPGSFTCGLGFGLTPWTDGSEPATRFRSLAKIRPQVPLRPGLKCACGGFLHAVAMTGAPIYVGVVRGPPLGPMPTVPATSLPPPSARPVLPHAQAGAALAARALTPIPLPKRWLEKGSSTYAALVLCCDISASMYEPATFAQHCPGTSSVAATPPAPASGLPYDEVVKALAQLFQELCGAPSRAPLHRDNMLVAVVRFAATASVFKLPVLTHGETELSVEWFTPKMLADAASWRPASSNALFDLGQIEDTIRDQILPAGCVSPDATNLHDALAEANRLLRDLATDVTEAKRGSRIPKDYAGILPAPLRGDVAKMLSVFVYSDGEINAPHPAIDCVSNTIQQAESLKSTHGRLKPSFVTAFFGDATVERHERGGRLLSKLASPCYNSQHPPERAYFSPAHARHLRHILHLATQVLSAGICPRCLEKYLQGGVSKG